VTRVVVSSAGRPAGTSPDAYDAVFPFAIPEVTAVSLVAATVPYPPSLLHPGAYVVLRVADMEVTVSNDNVLDRCFVALPCTDSMQKILPTAYSPARPMRRLQRMRVSFVDATGAPVDFAGADHILQFDVEHDDAAPSPGLIAPTIEARSVETVDPPAAETTPPQPADAYSGLGAELSELLREGQKV